MANINYLSHVKPLEDNGLADAAIAAVDGTLSAREIPVATLKQFFTDEELWLSTPSGYTGGLQDAYLDTLNLTKPQRDALGQLWSVAFEVSSSSTGTHELDLRKNGIAKNKQTCERVKSALDASVAAGHVTQENVDDFYAKGGGLLYPGATEQDVTDSRNNYNASVAEEQRQNDCLAVGAEVDNDYVQPAVGDGVTTGEQLRAQIKVGL